MLAVSANSADEWRSFSKPFPIRSVIPYGDGIMLATDGGIRFRTMDGDFVFHSERGLETSSFYAVVKDSLGTFAVSEYGLVAALNDNATSWRVLNRSFLSNNVKVRPDGAVLSGSILTIAFEDRLAFFDLLTARSILTIDRIIDQSLAIKPIDKMVVRGDSLYVRLGETAYVRKMDWKRMNADIQLSNPASWKKVDDMSSVPGLPQPDLNKVQIDGDTLAFEFLFDSEGKSRVKWAIKIPKGYFLVSDDFILYYNGKPKDKGYVNFSEFLGYTLNEAYELHAVPTGGVIAASIDGSFSYSNGTQWREPEVAMDYAGSYSSAYTSRMKVLSSTPDGHVFFHIWGLGYFLYSNWGEILDYSVRSTDNTCLESFLDDVKYVISVASTPAPDGSGFLVTTGNNRGYSIAYFTNNGEVHCSDNIGEFMMAGPMLARVDEDGYWNIYVGSRDGTGLASGGGLDIIKFPPPKSNGGELSKGIVKSYRGLQSTFVDMAYDSVENRLWGVSMSGIAYFDSSLDTLMTPTSTNGLRGAEYTSIDVDVHGNLWVGTANQGAYRLSLKNKSPDTLLVKSFNTKHGLLSNDVSDLAVDPVLGAVWFAHVNGVTMYSRKDLKNVSRNMTGSAAVGIMAYPIPFRPKVHDVFVIEGLAENAVVGIYNRGGSLVRSFRNEEIAGGRLEWNGTGKNGSLVTPGVYYYVVRTSSQTKKGKFIIIH